MKLRELFLTEDNDGSLAGLEQVPAGLTQIYDNGKGSGNQDVQYSFRFKTNHDYDTSAIGRNKLVRISADGKIIDVVADAPQDQKNNRFYVDARGEEIAWSDVPKAVKLALLKRLKPYKEI